MTTEEFGKTHDEEFTAAMKAGWTNHAASMAGVEQQCRNHLGEPRQIQSYVKLNSLISIEDFANQVKKYIKARGKDFRLNFFVDEAGQYIADNIKLMTNLQTVAESFTYSSNQQNCYERFRG